MGTNIHRVLICLCGYYAFQEIDTKSFDRYFIHRVFVILILPQVYGHMHTVQYETCPQRDAGISVHKLTQLNNSS